GPLVLRFIPPDVLLPFGPRLTVRVGGGAVVDQTAIGRPCPCPLGRDPRLLVMGLAPRRLVHTVCIATRVDPAAAGGGPVVLQVDKLRERRAGGDVESVDLSQDGLGAWLLGGAFSRIVPGQVEDRAVLRIGRRGVYLAQPPPQLQQEVQ